MVHRGIMYRDETYLLIMLYRSSSDKDSLVVRAVLLRPVAPHSISPAAGEEPLILALVLLVTTVSVQVAPAVGKWKWREKRHTATICSNIFP